MASIRLLRAMRQPDGILRSPCADPPHPSPVPSARLARRWLGPVVADDASILVVDDDAAVCWALRQALESRSHPVLTTASGRTAQRILQERPIRLVITDLRMPDVSGLALLLWMRDHMPATPVVVCSASSAPNGLRAIGNGACFWGFLHKPVDLEALFAYADRSARPGAFQPAMEKRAVPPALEPVDDPARPLPRDVPPDVSPAVPTRSATAMRLDARPSPRRSRPDDAAASWWPTLLVSLLAAILAVVAVAVIQATG